MTPIRNARNLGPITEAEMEAIGLTNLEQLQKIGWMEVCSQYGEAYPERINLNAFCAIIGAIFDQDWRRVDPDLKNAAKKLIVQLKKS